MANKSQVTELVKKVNTLENKLRNASDTNSKLQTALADRNKKIKEYKVKQNASIWERPKKAEEVKEEVVSPIRIEIHCDANKPLGRNISLLSCNIQAFYEDSLIAEDLVAELIIEVDNHKAEFKAIEMAKKLEEKINPNKTYRVTIYNDNASAIMNSPGVKYINTESNKADKAKTLVRNNRYQLEFYTLRSHIDQLIEEHANFIHVSEKFLEATDCTISTLASMCVDVSGQLIHRDKSVKEQNSMGAFFTSKIREVIQIKLEFFTKIANSIVSSGVDFIKVIEDRIKYEEELKKSVERKKNEDLKSSVERYEIEMLTKLVDEASKDFSEVYSAFKVLDMHVLSENSRCYVDTSLELLRILVDTKNMLLVTGIDKKFTMTDSKISRLKKKDLDEAMEIFKDIICDVVSVLRSNMTISNSVADKITYNSLITHIEGLEMTVDETAYASEDLCELCHILEY